MGTFMINLVLFGPPGSGKGTQAQMLEKKYDLQHISTGDLFRNEIGKQTELGMKAKEYIDRGDLVPDAITVGMLKNKLEDLRDSHGFLLDGFPRTVAQAEALDALMTDLHMEISSLVALEVPEDEIVNRILHRGKTSGRSDDNDRNIIRKRFSVYMKQTCPVFEYFEKKGKTVKVNGVGSIHEIFHRICFEIENLES